jgi:hypothetical protein
VAQLVFFQNKYSQEHGRGEGEQSLQTTKVPHDAILKTNNKREKFIHKKKQITNLVSTDGVLHNHPQNKHLAGHSFVHSQNIEWNSAVQDGLQPVPSRVFLSDVRNGSQNETKRGCVVERQSAHDQLIRVVLSDLKPIRKMVMQFRVVIEKFDRTCGRATPKPAVPV